MIDIHCHILPGIDDGPDTVEESVALARAAVAAGTLAIVATPHVSWDYPVNDAARIAAGVAELRVALAAADVPLQLRTGAELAMTRAAELPDEELVALRLGGPEGTHLLVECPLSPTATGLEQVLGILRSRGHEIVLAHPERCPAFQRDPAAYERLIAQGMLGQVTAGALVGRFGRTVQDVAHRFVREGLAHAIASDGHSAERRRPSIGPELVEAGYGEQASWLAHEVPYAILTGGPIPPAPAMPERRRSGLARLLGR
ncbi:MAG: Protein-tyrosine-phosphatase [Solirubrobacterales bacterium]|nr:Protein-tyrosine-phosphatase [Solirubrobacterales bacterium]